MTADNPGTWPDQGKEDGREYSARKKGNILAGVCPLCGDPIAQGEGRMVCQNCAPQKWDSRDFTDPCYTAAEMKAARLETVEECIRIATKTLRGGTTTDPPYDAGIWDVIESIEKLKEEICE